MTITFSISFLRQLAAGKVFFHHNYRLQNLVDHHYIRGHYVVSSYTKEYSKSA
jgi:hypothetical protein